MFTMLMIVALLMAQAVPQQDPLTVITGIFAASVAVMLGFFLRNIYADFKALVTSVQNIEKTIVHHGDKIEEQGSDIKELRERVSTLERNR